MTDRDIAAALAEAASTLHATQSTAETLDAIVESARRSVPGVDHVGVSLAHRNGRIETKSGTGPLVWELDTLQYSLHEGPCVHAVEQDPVVVVEDARHEQRWPRYIPQAVRLGLRGQIGLRLFTEDKTIGGLNLYSTHDRLDPGTVDSAHLFAVHAALALGRAVEVEGLNEALSTRKVIGQAIGIVMERYRLTEERAFAFLVRASSTGNIKLRDIAEELVRQLEDHSEGA